MVANPAAGPSQHVGTSGLVATVPSVQSVEQLAQTFSQVVQPRLTLQRGPVVGHMARVAGGVQETTANVNNIEGAAQKQGMAVEPVTSRLDAVTLRLEALGRAPLNSHFDPWVSAAA